jgi:hypothetical protein
MWVAQAGLKGASDSCGLFDVNCVGVGDAADIAAELPNRNLINPLRHT